MTRRYKGLQGVTRGDKGLQGIQGVTRGDKRLQGVTNTTTTTNTVLKYYDAREEVTLQCDASERGLGATLMQKGQPVAFASRTLSTTEQRYAQIKKESRNSVWL